ncbi:MAG: pitrilysin family protein [Acidobacteriota bacterium]
MRIKKRFFPIHLLPFIFLSSSLLSYPGTGNFILKNLNKKVLNNGLTIITQNDNFSKLTVMQILVKGGTSIEPPEKNGIAYLTTRLSIEIPDWSKVQILTESSSGISLNCTGDYSLITLKCLSEKFEETLSIICKSMTDPLFSSLRINRIKDYMTDQIKAEQDNPAQMAYNAYLKGLYRDTGYGNPVFGTEESLKKIKKGDIKNFYGNFFKAGNMIIVVSSDLDNEKLIEIIQKYFLKFPPGKPHGITTFKMRALKNNFFFEKEKKQSFISIGYPLREANPKNFILATLLETLLGKGINSRLWQLRHKEKLAYNVGSKAISMKHGGIIETYIETQNEKREITLEALKKELQDLREKGLTEEELNITKINAKANFLRLNETKDKRTRTLAFFEALGLGYDFFNKFFDELDKINLQEIDEFIRECISPEKEIQVIIGPKKD